MPPTPQQQKDLDNKAALFNKEFEALQVKYGFKVVAKFPLGGGAIVFAPILLEDISGILPPTQGIASPVGNTPAPKTTPKKK